MDNTKPRWRRCNPRKAKALLYQGYTVRYRWGVLMYWTGGRKDDE